jgi:hypothetical protein
MMRNKLIIILALIMAVAVMLCFTACGKKDVAAEGQTSEEIEEQLEEMPEVVTAIDGIDDDLGPLLPLQIQSVTLYEDGTVALVPTEDLKRNEIKDDAEDTEAIYPFADSGKVKQIYLVEYGNGGFRTIMALLDDGTLSAINGKALVEDHIVAVMDGVAGRDNFTDVEQRSDESGHYIIGHTEDGQEVELDYSLNF